MLAIIGAVSLSYPEMVEYGQIAVLEPGTDLRVSPFAWFARTLGLGLAGQALAFLGEAEYRRGLLAESVLHTELAIGDAEENQRFWDYALLHGLASYPRAARGGRWLDLMLRASDLRHVHLRVQARGLSAVRVGRRAPDCRIGIKPIRGGRGEVPVSSGTGDQTVYYAPE